MVLENRGNCLPGLGICRNPHFYRGHPLDNFHFILGKPMILNAAGIKPEACEGQRLTPRPSGFFRCTI